MTNVSLRALFSSYHRREATGIIEELIISAYIAETHRRNLLQKLNLRNAAALARYAIEHGLAEE